MPVSDRELVGVTQVEYVERCTDRPTYENVCTGFVDSDYPSSQEAFALNNADVLVDV